MADKLKAGLSFWPDMDGVIPISNNSAMAIKLADDGESAITWYLGQNQEVRAMLAVLTILFIALLLISGSEYRDYWG